MGAAVGRKVQYARLKAQDPGGAADHRAAMLDIDACLRYLVESGGSDLHLKVPSQPLVRLDGELVPIPDTTPLTEGEKGFVEELELGFGD